MRRTVISILPYAQLQGASLREVQLQGASLVGAQLQGASLLAAELQGASLHEAGLQGARLFSVTVWHARGIPKMHLAHVSEPIDQTTKPWRRGTFRCSSCPLEGIGVAAEISRVPEAEADPLEFARWRDGILKTIPETGRTEAIPRLSALDPALGREPKDVINPEFWAKALLASKDEERWKRHAIFLADLGCDPARYVPRDLLKFESAPYVARGLLKFEPFIGSAAPLLAERLRKGKSDHSACPGVRGFTDEDWAHLDKLVADAQKLTTDQTTK